MEGWDGTADGEPSDLTRRRWRNFGISGAKLMWGGEAVAVRHDGRANPHQLLITPQTVAGDRGLREELVARASRAVWRRTPTAICTSASSSRIRAATRGPMSTIAPEPLAGWHQPDARSAVSEGVRVLEDAELDRAGRRFHRGGARSRATPASGSSTSRRVMAISDTSCSARATAAGRTAARWRTARDSCVTSSKASAPGSRLTIVVRLSVFDTVPYRKRPDGDRGARRAPGTAGLQDWRSSGFGVVWSPTTQLDAALEECRAVLATARAASASAGSASTAGSPYYNPHVQRPAMFPPLDGYEPPEDPLRGVARQIRGDALLKQRVSAAGLRGIGVQLSAGVAAARGAARRARTG